MVDREGGVESGGMQAGGGHAGGVEAGSVQAGSLAFGEVDSLSSDALLAETRALVRRSHLIEADLLVYLGEVDQRKLYLDCACSSMFAFCVGELGFSEEAAYNRILVARAGRKLPAVIAAARSGKVHLTGLRLLAPHLTVENHSAVLAEAAGKSKRQIEEIVARLAPQAPVPTTIRKVPDASPLTARADTRRMETLTVRPELPPVRNLDPQGGGPTLPPEPYQRNGRPGPPPPFPAPQPIAPLSANLFKIQFTATRAFRDKLRETQGLLRHSVPDGDLEIIIGRALDLLIAQVKKERFGVGRKARSPAKEGPAAARAAKAHPRAAAAGNRAARAGASGSRHIPDAIKRAVYERDGGRCTFVSDDGKRCKATELLTFEHVDGFARTGQHSVARIRLLCRAHNQHCADRMYGRAFMDKARSKGSVPAIRTGTSPVEPAGSGASATLPTRPGTHDGSHLRVASRYPATSVSSS